MYKTYARNECEMKKENCGVLSINKITKIYDGACKKDCGNCDQQPFQPG